MWAYESVFYQIYPLGFCGAPFENDGVLEHRIEKVNDWIPHIKKLGADAIYFSPVFESDTHGYNTRDYTKIDTRLGTNEDFANVCNNLHKEGIRVVLDGVFNHVGRGFWAFEDVLKNREQSPYVNWFGRIAFDGNSNYNDGLWYEGWEEDARPVWLAAWSGMNTIAQAIWKVHSTRSPEEFQKFVAKIRIYDVLGQDDAGAWIAKSFPEIFYIRNTEIYGWGPGDEWIKDNVQSRKPLGGCYPDRIWASEGDSPSFLYVYANGLNVPDSLAYGGWGGRFKMERTAGIRGMDFIEKSGKSEKIYDPYFMHASTSEGIAAINKWRQHILNDFAARMCWATDCST